MNGNYPPSLSHVLATEGGFGDDPKDPGGATNKGVTQKEYDIWRTAHGQPIQSVKLIDPNEIDAFYHATFWNAVSGDLLPSGVDYCTFDCAVNSGPHEAAKWLQQSVGVNADGVFGPITLAALSKADPRWIIHSMCAERLGLLRTLPTWSHFGDGWTNRVNSVEITARGMV